MPPFERDRNIDLLRLIGLVMIMLAHVGSTPLIEQLRNFDVPLMVLISGASFAMSRRQESFLHYCIRRLRRLIVPVWIFLTAYFLAWCVLFPSSFPTKYTIATSYSLTSGIGYVWIIRIFAFIAILSPWIVIVKNKLGRHFLPAFAASMIAYEIILIISRPYSSTLPGKIFDLGIIYPFPYYLIFALGHELNKIKPKSIALIALICGAVFGGYASVIASQHGSFIPTEEFKFPPSTYYFSYALLVALPLWILVPTITKRINNSIWKLIEFVSKNSIWIYLWHIPLVSIYTPSITIRLMLTFFCSVILAYIQIEIILNRVILPRVQSRRIQDNLIAVFSG